MRNIIIFGASKLGQYVYDILKGKYNIVNFCDNNSNKWGNYLNGIKIISPEVLRTIGDATIIIASTYYKEISSQLNHMGIKDYKIFTLNQDDKDDIGKMLEDRVEFENILVNNNIKLNYDDNKDDINILKEIFKYRGYSKYFPFYKKATILDIGAHKGYFTLFSYFNTNKDSKIISLEPDRKNFNVLKSNCNGNNLNERNVMLINSGVYSKSGNLDLFISNSYNNSIFNSEKNDLSSNIKESITVISLKDLLNMHNINKVDFMKMDCEGAEYPTLFETDANTLSKIKVISLEFHDLKDVNYNGNELIKFMENNGYKIVEYKYEPTNMNLNFGKIICLRE
ncbi:hypothetical protein N494_12900 [Clostridium botulinum A2B7 92]|uniref:FkbM family methyltransferase n=1 Tax=Clostridium botulinum TaxID=1491 RepID=UPI0007E07B99|nr:FkbM family methyltransferase [Clostridium botulinum]KEI97157.1 hypothetical protein N494_12900 [Clostridium botulinum A2B7 92]